jgi:hypothetical protein
MKTAVLLCGANEVGKTKTLKKFFGVSLTTRLGPMQLLERTLNGKKIYAVSLGSPQELSRFCKVDEVEANIEKRIRKCEVASHGQDYVLIMPFGVYARKGKAILNEPCILEPIEWLKAKGFKVVAIYLRKEKTTNLSLKDTLMKKIALYEIKSDEDYDRQAKELENIIKNLP